jgi:hypothetical protein
MHLVFYYHPSGRKIFGDDEFSFFCDLAVVGRSRREVAKAESTFTAQPPAEAGGYHSHGGRFNPH